MENTTTEYKRELNAELEKEVCAFVNTIGGEIYIGVDNEGNIYGVDDADKVSLAVQDRIKNNISPSVVGLYGTEIKEKNGKKYIVVTVAGGLEKPYYIKKYGMTSGGCFMRVGPQSIQMPQALIDDWFAKRIRNTLQNVVSPNQNLTFTQLKIFYEEKGYDVTGTHFLKNLELFTDDGKYNYAAYLLADNNGTSIKVARFNGIDKTDIAERNEYGRCCLIKSAINVLEKLNVENITVVRVGNAARRVEKRLVDGDALRETVLNAIIHNDYINGAYPVFEIYDDRIEIVSSGGLPIGLTEEEFFEGRSLPRNKELMRIFSDLDMCEQLGSGMKKILKAYSKEIFNISEHFIAVRLVYNRKVRAVRHKDSLENSPKNSPENSLENSLEKLTATETGILAVIVSDKNATYKTIAEAVGKEVSTVKKAIKKLKEKGIIRRVGSDRIGYWERLK